MTKLICGWCRKEIEANIVKDKWGERNILICPYCTARLPSSRIELTNNLVGIKHIHIEYKNGDVA